MNKKKKNGEKESSDRLFIGSEAGCIATSSSSVVRLWRRRVVDDLNRGGGASPDMEGDGSNDPPPIASELTAASHDGLLLRQGRESTYGDSVVREARGVGWAAGGEG